VRAAVRTVFHQGSSAIVIAVNQPALIEAARRADSQGLGGAVRRDGRRQRAAAE
jgi:hypothetical protein